MRFLGILAALSVTALPAYADHTEARRRAEKVLIDAKFEAMEIPKQADALAELAWPTDGSRDPLVQYLAREELVGFGEHGMAALGRSIKRAPEIHRADVTAALISAMRQVRSGVPPDYLASLQDAVWFGTAESRRLAIPELARYRFPGIALAAADAAELNPELRKVAIRTVGLSGDVRGRFFLGDILREGSPEERRMAAASLSLIGGEALAILREAIRSESRDVREVAILALLPSAGLDDLTVLHEYAGRHPDDDPEVLARVRERAQFLEDLLEAQQTGDGATPEPDF